MGEVQSHGFEFEDQIIRVITNLSKEQYQPLLEGAYTSSWDIAKGVHSDVNYSIKTSKEGKSIDSGDILRMVRHCRDTPFTFVVGAYRQIGNIKRYSNILEFDITPDNYQTLWGGITEDALKPFVQYVKDIPRGPQGQADNKKLWKQKRQEIYTAHGKGLFKIAAKIGSDNQRRVQCSVKIADLIQAEIPYRKYETEYKGLQLPYEQISPPRNSQKT